MSSTPYVSASSKPVIVQGSHVNAIDGIAYGDGLLHNNTPQQAKRQCRDVFWAILFYAHLGVMVYCTVAYTPGLMADVAENASYYNHNYDDGQRYLQKAHQSLLHFIYGSKPKQQQTLQSRWLQDADDDVDYSVNPTTLIVVVCIGSLLSLTISTLALGLIMSFAETLVKMALFFNILLFGVLSLLSLIVGSIGSGLMFLLLTGFMAYYTCRVWDRIPFAASNLVTAVTAVRANMGLALYAYLSVLLVALWSVWWSIGTLATLYVTNGCQANGECQSEVNGGIVFLFLLSFYWTMQVIANVVHCTTAGTVGTWWFTPEEANGCCSKAVRDSYIRSLTYSFGSICLASLVVAIVQAIREIVHSLRENGDSFIACIAECLIACIESLVELFNRFALVYCAVHGQNFLQAARSVMDLFRARGWTAIITDLLVDTVLFMVSLGVGLLVGILALIIAATMRSTATTLAAAFVIGFIVGYAICTTLFSVVSSAVNTVIVCYAEAPSEFQQNHPQLSANMRASWRQAWPNDFSY